MTQPPHRRVHPADASVIVSVRGVPSWAAILIALICGAGGLVAARTGGAYDVNWTFGAIFVAGIALAALAVRRGSIFTAMVQAPIVLTALVLAALKLLGGEGTISTAAELIAAFPIMAVATGVGLLLGLVRVISQPVHRSAPPPDIDDDLDGPVDTGMPTSYPPQTAYPSQDAYPPQAPDAPQTPYPPQAPYPPRDAGYPHFTRGG